MIIVGGVPDIITLRVSFTGETDYELYMPRERQVALFDMLSREGVDLDLGLAGTCSLMQTRPL